MVNFGFCAEKTGLHIETRGDALARRIERLRRQFLCASETSHSFAPHLCT